MSAEKDFLEKLKSTLPGLEITTEKSELLEYGKDWTKIYQPDPVAIAFPKSTEEVSRILKLCSDMKYPVVPSGGRTGLAGGAMATKRELVLSLKRMSKIGAVDLASRTVQVEAGAITEAIHTACEPFGLTWPVDFASKGSSCVGGNIATNAGGVNVIRYGLTRNWVLGLTVVLPNGEILELNGALEKNNTGLDLRQLFIGSEGTLGIITGATLKLSPLPGESDVFLFALQDLPSVLRLFRKVRESGLTLNAYEFFTDRCHARVLKNLGLRLPFSTHSSHYVLIDLEKPENDEALEKALEEWLGIEGVLDGTLAQSSTERNQFWMLREGISESLASTGLPHKNDISLPIAALEGFCEEFEKLITARYPDWEICNFGHIGDGNLHVNIMKPDSLSLTDFRAKTSVVDHDVFTLLKKYKGSISAEHGIGLLKKDYLSYSRSPEELALFKGIKAAFDPNGILNPGKVF